MSELIELPLNRLYGPLPRRAMELIEEGLERGRSIDCFDLIPSNHVVIWSALSAVPRGRFVEWGSALGVVTGLAELLGFEARGIELNAEVAEASRVLLGDFGLSATIETGDYHEIDRPADVYFTYCWPGQMVRTEQRFSEVAPDDATLLICHGAEDVRCKVKDGG